MSTETKEPDVKSRLPSVVKFFLPDDESLQPPGVLSQFNSFDSIDSTASVWMSPTSENGDLNHTQLKSGPSAVANGSGQTHAHAVCTQQHVHVLFSCVFLHFVSWKH